MTARTSADNPRSWPESTLTELVFEAVDAHGDAPAFRRLLPSKDVTDIGFREALALMRRVAAAMKAHGLGRGDRAAILAENRPEWAISDYACLCSGVVSVPIYPTLTAPQVGYILENSGARLVFTSSEELARKVVEAAASCPQDIHIVAFDGPVEGEDRVQAWDAFLESGRSTLEAEDDDAFRASALQAQPHDVATILYTSGTTGQPKGVMLTHNNVASNVRAVADVLHQKPRTRLGPGDSTVSFLPLSHILQRMADFLFFRRGLTIAYPRSMATLVEDLGTLGPTVVVSVPRIYEKIYGGIVSATGLKKKIVFWAIGIADQVATERLAGRTPGGWLAFRYRIADKLVFSKVKRAVGGRLRYFVSGGGPLAPALNRFFYSIGLQVLEGYGLTETSPVTNVNTIEEFRIGSVGQPLPGTEIRIASDGEILIRGPQVMKGYYKNPEATAAVLDSDGWFSTGDIGEIDDDGFLKITDRKKDLLVTAGGKNVAPQPIENLVKTHPLVEQAILVGDARPFCAMMIVPAFPVLEAWAQDAGIAYSSVADLVAQPAVVDHIRTQVEPMLRDLASFEKPKSFALLDEEFTIDNGFLTPTLKVKRNVVRERLGHVIDGIYAGASGSSQS